MVRNISDETAAFTDHFKKNTKVWREVRKELFPPTGYRPLSLPGNLNEGREDFRVFGHPKFHLALF